jgi:lipoate-protein ligase A
MPFQMALDEFFFRSMENGFFGESPILRFYFSSSPWITVGYAHQEMRRNGKIPICRRITGGGYVAHGNDLIFSLVARKDHEDSFSSVRLSYWKIHEAVKLAFEEFGHRPRFFRCDENLPKGTDCFRYPIATDLALNDKKIAGGAQKRSGSVFLHQESVQIPGQEAGYGFMENIRKAFETVFDVRITGSDLIPEWLIEAEELAKLKYLS